MCRDFIVNQCLYASAVAISFLKPQDLAVPNELRSGKGDYMSSSYATGVVLGQFFECVAVF